MRIFGSICLSLFLSLVIIAEFSAAQSVDPAVSEPGEIAALEKLLWELAKRDPPLFGSTKLSEIDQADLKTAIEQGTMLLAKAPTDEQKYWAAEILLKARLTQAMSLPPQSLSELRKIENVVLFLEKKPEKVEILSTAKYQILKFSILLLSKPGDDIPNPYKVKDAVKRYVAENPKYLDSFSKLLVDVALQYAGKDRHFTIETLKEVAELYTKSEFLDDRNYVEKLSDTAKRFEMIDNPVAFSGLDLGGNRIASTDFKNKVVLVDFWATWCPQCVASLPEMKRLYETFNKRGFEIVGVSVDKGTNDLTKFVEDKKIPWKILSDTITAEKGGTKLSKHFGVSDFPTLMLIGRDGKMIATDFDLKTLEKELIKQFNNGKDISKLPLETKPEPITPSIYETDKASSLGTIKMM